MDFHDFARFLWKSWCVSHPPPKLCDVMCRPSLASARTLSITLSFSFFDPLCGGLLDSEGRSVAQCCAVKDDTRKLRRVHNLPVPPYARLNLLVSPYVRIQHRCIRMRKLQHRAGGFFGGGSKEHPKIDYNNHGHVWHADFGPSSLVNATVFHMSVFFFPEPLHCSSNAAEGTA